MMMEHKALVIDLASRRRNSRPRNPPSGAALAKVIPIRYALIPERICMGGEDRSGWCGTYSPPPPYNKDS